METAITIPYHIAVSQKWMLALFFKGEMESKVKIKTPENTYLTYGEFFANQEQAVPPAEWDQDICSMDLSSGEEDD